MTCEILCVGAELLLGDIINTDAAFVAKRLSELGITSYRQSVVGDNADRLRDALTEAFSRADLVILTGGLGPTLDDITKKITAEYFGVPMHMDETVREDLIRFFEKAGRPMTENNLLQALIPEGAEVFSNRWGTAPGIALSRDINGERKTAILLPGPPSECEPMFTECVTPYLRRLSGQTGYSLNLHLYGIGESRAEAILHDIMEKSQNPTVAPYACEHEVRIRITAFGESEAACRAMCRAKAQEIRETEAGAYIYTETNDPWEAKNAMVLTLLAILRYRGMTFGTAESCTAGMISSAVGDIPGASDVLMGGIVSYANAVKEQVLGVPHTVLEDFGAVSESCAAEMAKGAKRLLGCDVAVSVTGVAGPGGGTEEKPVGTVCFGLAVGNDVFTETVRFNSKADRARIRRLTVAHAMMTVIKRLAY